MHFFHESDYGTSFPSLRIQILTISEAETI